MRTSFKAKYRGTCARCHLEIAKGDAIYYQDEGIVHARHKQAVKPVVVCRLCHMAQPCECDALGSGP